MCVLFKLLRPSLIIERQREESGWGASEGWSWAGLMGLVSRSPAIPQHMSARIRARRAFLRIYIKFKVSKILLCLMRKHRPFKVHLIQASLMKFGHRFWKIREKRETNLKLRVRESTAFYLYQSGAKKPNCVTSGLSFQNMLKFLRRAPCNRRL